MSTIEIIAVVGASYAVGAVTGTLAWRWLMTKKPHEPVEPEGSTPDEARAIVAENPPKTVVWKPHTSDQPAPKCTCHNRELASGDEVLFWPVPDVDGNDSGVVDLFCKQTIEEARS